MGIVYKAFDRELKRWVALKIPSLDVATTSEARRFRTEAQSMAQLKHRNIVRVLDVKDYEGRDHPVGSPTWDLPSPASEAQVLPSDPSPARVVRMPG